MSLQVIGAGFGRTGTGSLQTVLQILGFDACYHMLEVMPQGPAGIQLWEQAVRGEPDWDTIFSGYKSTVDFPGCRVLFRHSTGHFSHCYSEKQDCFTGLCGLPCLYL